MKKQINESVFFEQVSGLLDERSRRLVAAGLAITFGHGGIVRVSQASGLSRTTIQNGVQELKSGSFLKPNKVHSQRSEGGGRKVIEYVQPEIIKDMESLIEPHVSGNPESPLRWSSMSLRKLSDELGRRGHVVSYVTVRRLLEEQGYTLQSNKKSHEGKSVVDRNEQFEHINETAKAFLAESQPIISVDAKKKELVGEFKNNGKEYRLSGHPRKVNVYDFIDPTLGKAAPYGVYDSTENEGFVSVGISHDTAEFAVETIEKWWKLMGKQKYTDAHSLFITADGGGSNGYRNRMWKKKLQVFADKHNMNVYVSHFPPGTSKWNKIEHRMFSAITMNWRGKPLTSLEVIVNLIANTTTRTGLKIRAEIDHAEYKTGEQVSDSELASLKICGHSFHPEWNYVIFPRND